jgi:murein DD-endopeptidase MepM/ murein hydrolase activator NlpD
VAPGTLVQTFAQARGADRRHEALDILAPRGTPVVAVEDGRVVKLFWSNNGGHTIYQFDPSTRYAYYYAHLERYAEELTEGQFVARGTVIGYVGTSGNADASTPHLHFAIFELGPERQWWKGTPIDPYLVLGPVPAS